MKQFSKYYIDCSMDQSFASTLCYLGSLSLSFYITISLNLKLNISSILFNEIRRIFYKITWFTCMAIKLWNFYLF